MPQSAIDDFTPLVEKQHLSWKQARQLCPLSHFLSDSAKGWWGGKEFDDFIKKENPDLSNDEIDLRMFSRPLIKYGNWTFSIYQSTSIKVKHNGELKKEIQVEKHILSLAIENQYLFCLCTDGIIHKLDYKTLNCPLIEIETAYSKDLSDTLHKLNCLLFSIQEGHITLLYQLGLEIISCHQPEKRQLIRFEDMISPATIQQADDIPIPENLLIKGNKLFILSKSKIFIWNLFTNTRECELHLKKIPTERCLTRLLIEKENLFVYDSSNGRLQTIDLRTKCLIRSMQLKTQTNLSMHSAIICNLFINQTWQTITVVDHDRNCEVKQIDNCLIDLNDNVDHFQSKLKKLVKVVLNNRKHIDQNEKPIETQKSEPCLGLVFQTDVKSPLSSILYSDSESFTPASCSLEQGFEKIPFLSKAAVIPFIGTIAGIIRCTLALFHTIGHLFAALVTFNQGHLMHAVKGGAELIRGMIEAIPAIGTLFAVAIDAHTHKYPPLADAHFHRHSYFLVKIIESQ